MNIDNATDLIRLLFDEACSELLESMGCSVERITKPDLSTTYIPIVYIDAGTDDFELLLTLQLPHSALSMTYPIQDQLVDIDEQELEEWLLELSNRLLGLLKSKLSRHNCNLNSGLPSYEFGKDESQSINQCRYVPFYYAIDNEPAELGITLETFGDTISISEDAKENDNNVQAGDLDLFF